MNYQLPEGYVSQAPSVYSEGSDDRAWQPDVYPLAAKIARAEGCVRLIDFGCSTGGKLLGFADEFDLIGLDLPGNLPTDGRGVWLGHDFDSRKRLPLGKDDLTNSVVICSDVIEHMNTPEILLGKLKQALKWANCLVVSTPDRERTRGIDDMGPPANDCHAREWTAAEFVAWLESEGVDVVEQVWQRSFIGAEGEATTVVVCK